jgi:hypothetical protein
LPTKDISAVQKIGFIPFVTVLLVSILNSGCGEPSGTPPIESAELISLPEREPAQSRSLSPEFKKYWYAGVAEINSYTLEQARYGETRDGEAVLIFVTEPFNAEKQVKADGTSRGTPSVMKLNRVRKFLTGVYPYSIMSSIFYPVGVESHALKITTSVQEWCGHVYAQLNNREAFEIQSHSYFEAEADQSFNLEKNILEDELWTLLRINPDEIPRGTQLLIPSLEYLRLKHRPIKAYTATVEITEEKDSNQLTLTYPDLDRTLSIQFRKDFPYQVLGWTETYPSGREIMTSSASLKKTILSPYWQKNSNSDVSLRDSLGLGMR